MDCVNLTECITNLQPRPEIKKNCADQTVLQDGMGKSIAAHLLTHGGK